MGESFHFDDVFRKGSEAIATVPTRIGKNAFSALWMPVITVLIPDYCTRTPASKTKIPFKALERPFNISILILQVQKELNEPVYVITELEMDWWSKVAVFEQVDAVTGRNFIKVCHDHHSLGVWGETGYVVANKHSHSIPCMCFNVPGGLARKQRKSR